MRKGCLYKKGRRVLGVYTQALGRKGEGHLGKKACEHPVTGLDDNLEIINPTWQLVCSVSVHRLV